MLACLKFYLASNNGVVTIFLSLLIYKTWKYIQTQHTNLADSHIGIFIVVKYCILITYWPFTEPYYQAYACIEPSSAYKKQVLKTTYS